jgi:hypothetical protein
VVVDDAVQVFIEEMYDRLLRKGFEAHIVEYFPVVLLFIDLLEVFDV